MSEPFDLPARVAELERRFRSLVQQNRLLKGGILLVCILLAMGAMSGPEKGPAQEVRAKRFVLEDQNGLERIVMETARLPINNVGDQRKDGFAILKFVDPSGKSRIELSTTNGEIAEGSLGLIRMYTQQGKRRTELITGKRGHFAIFDDDGKQRIESLPRPPQKKTKKNG